jgi:hypothetical protein
MATGDTAQFILPMNKIDRVLSAEHRRVRSKKIIGEGVRRRPGHQAFVEASRIVVVGHEA